MKEKKKEISASIAKFYIFTNVYIYHHSYELNKSLSQLLPKRYDYQFFYY